MMMVLSCRMRFGADYPGTTAHTRGRRAVSVVKSVPGCNLGLSCFAQYALCQVKQEKVWPVLGESIRMKIPPPENESAYVDCMNYRAVHFYGSRPHIPMRAAADYLES